MLGLEEWVVTTDGVLTMPDLELTRKVRILWVKFLNRDENYYILNKLIDKNISIEKYTTDNKCIEHAINIRNHCMQDILSKYENINDIVLHQFNVQGTGLVGYLSIEGSYLALTPVYDTSMNIVESIKTVSFEEQKNIIETINKKLTELPMLEKAIAYCSKD